MAKRGQLSSTDSARRICSVSFFRATLTQALASHRHPERPQVPGLCSRMHTHKRVYTPASPQTPSLGDGCVCSPASWATLSGANSTTPLQKGSPNIPWPCPTPPVTWVGSLWGGTLPFSSLLPPVGQLVEWGADVAQEGAGLTSISHGFQLIPTFWDSYKRLRCSRNISEYLWALSSASLLPLSPSSEIKEALFASSPTIT